MSVLFTEVTGYGNGRPAPTRYGERSSTVDLRSRRVEEYIASSVDEAIGEMLGQAVVDYFYAVLREKGISRRDLSGRMRLFCSLLDDEFGVQSAAIQRQVARKLFGKLGLEFSHDEQKMLLNYIQDAKEMIRNVER